MDEPQQVFAFERYLDPRAARYGVVRDDLPYSAGLELLEVQVNLEFGTRFSQWRDRVQDDNACWTGFAPQAFCERLLR